jgi:hypothetical protein
LTEKTIHVRIAKAFEESKYYRVYVLKFEDGNSAGDLSFAMLSFGEFQNEKHNFHRADEGNGTVQVIIHRCPDMQNIQNAYYVWQPKTRKSRLPAECPRCHYRLDIMSKKERESETETVEEKSSVFMEFTKNFSEETSSPDEIGRIIERKMIMSAACSGEEFQISLSEDYLLRINKNRFNLVKTRAL